METSSHINLFLFKIRLVPKETVRNEIIKTQIILRINQLTKA